jgi:uncharacterized membrane protein YqjE
MTVNETRPSTPTGELIREAIDGARDLLKAEVELAKGEVREEVKAASRAAIAFTIGAMLGFLALAVLLITLGIATFPHILPTLIIGIVLLVLAAVAVGIGAAVLPRKPPLGHTRERLGTDVQVLKERLA